MFLKRLLFVFLLLAALSSFAGRAMAQAQPQQFVVVYVEFKSADTKAGSEVLEELAAQAENSSGVIRFNVLQQIDRPNFFALFETWSSAQTFADFQNSSATQAIQTQLTPLLEAPLDQRPGILLTGAVNPRDQHAQARQIFVITHVDVDPQNVPQAQPLLNTFVSDSLNDPGAQTFAVLSQIPTPNHFQLVETFANLKAFEAHVSEQHTVDFRTNIDPLLGAPYDERLYQFVKQ
ncbi:MAG: antibiotic biosynthesis monooxygenase [Candidatus Angelobacter sp.]|nr:antibiotic biosynthesis monooxygenase [Candidatus Angelobacter sp.]